MLLYPVLMLPCRKIMKSLSRVRKILSKVVWQFKGKNSESFVFFFSSSASNQLIWFFKPLFSVIFSFFFRSVEITLKCDESQYPGNTGSGVTERYEPKNSTYVRFWRITVFCSFFLASYPSPIKMLFCFKLFQGQVQIPNVSWAQLHSN